MNKVFLAPYKMGSKSGKELARNLGCKRIRLEGSRYRPRSNRLVINWGRSTPFVGGERALNHPDAVHLASDKLLALIALQNAGVRVPPFSTGTGAAYRMIHEGHKVVCRTLLRANSGRGIVLANNPSEIVEAPLYTQYIPKTHEYRVHVFKGEVLDVQRKMRDRDVEDEDVNWQIRNHSNGFIFGREGVSLPESALSMCKQAVDALGLDFGAVDLIYNERQDKYYVLEVNTAPGLTGTTLQVYTDAINALIVD